LKALGGFKSSLAGILVAILGMVAVGCAPTGAQMQDAGEAERIRVSPGMAFAEIRARLGEPASAERLKSDQPSVMGARIVSYVRRTPPIGFVLQDGRRREGTRLDLVLDPNGEVLRLVDNPNPLPGETAGAPVQRGRTGHVVAALVPMR